MLHCSFSGLPLWGLQFNRRLLEITNMYLCKHAAVVSYIGLKKTPIHWLCLVESVFLAVLLVCIDNTVYCQHPLSYNGAL